MPAVAETWLHRAGTRRRAALDAPDVLRGRSGARSHRGAQDAVDTRPLTRPCGPDNVVVEADIKGFFDPSTQAWMLCMLQERIAEGACLRRIQPGRKAGGLDTDGTVRHPARGTPHGGIVSPVLAHGSLH